VQHGEIVQSSAAPSSEHLRRGQRRHGRPMISAKDALAAAVEHSGISPEITKFRTP
jgi:hypothetical protein